MPEVIALKSFNGRYGPIRTGQQFNAEPGYAAQLKRNKLIRFLDEGSEPAPSKNRSIPEAPGRAGKGAPGTGDQPPPTDPQQQAGGMGITSSSVRAAPASRKLISKPSATGGRRGTPTQRKPKKAETPPSEPGAA